MRKNLDISKPAVKLITIQAVTEGTVFKLKAEKILEDHAKNLIKNLTIKQIMAENKEMSIRLFTALELYEKKFPLVNDIIRSRFLETKNTGERSWKELSELLSTKYGINGN
jgi:hypothetical protein